MAGTLDGLFGNAISVQRGQSSIQSGNYNATQTIASVDMNKSFVIMNSYASGSATSDAGARLLDATTLKFNRNNTSGLTIVNWEVITVD